jgi:membrane peptidoglycan carboxypeptidase
VNDHRDTRHRRGEPAWPTGDDPDGARWPRSEESQERTGFWSPLWDEDDEAPAPRPAARANGRSGNGGGAARTQHVPQPTQAIRRPGGPNAPTVALPGRGPGYPRVPRDNSNDPTELLPATPGGTRREPDLLTHRDPDYDEDGDLLEDEDRPLTEEERRRRRKKIWRRVRRTMYVFLVLMIVGPVLAFLITYQFVAVPSPEDVRTGADQVVTMKYANGDELTKIVPEGANRTFVTWEELRAAPKVLNAVFAAEDNTFMTNAGFDISGVMRAGWNQLSGGSGGGSTITQQYIKVATGNDQKSPIRKAVEVVKAYKMNRTFSKEQIITAYLNTIYLGRSAYGIAAASKAYFGAEFKNLNQSQAALLAGMIQGPGKFKDTAYMQRRWNYVMDQLVSNGWLPAAERKAEQFPAPVPYEQTKTKALTGPRGQIQRAVFNELQEKAGLSDDDVQRGGFTIQTTIDPQAQSLAEDAVNQVMKGQPQNLRPALVAVDPKTGEIKAYYGGADGVGTNWADAPQEPGSSFKPFDLVALLKTGKGLGEEYDVSVNTFPGRSKPVANASNPTCKMCTVADAMKQSLNTIFYNIVTNTLRPGGPQKVADAAKEAGITEPLAPAAQDSNISIGGGQTQVSTVDMASAYATFAARGMYRSPHLVAKVLNPDGSVYWQASADEKQAFDSDAKQNEKIARNVTEALLPVPGYSKIPCADGRLCAGKTGTHQLGDTGNNAKAWMVGYTPQLSTAVSLSGANGEAINDAKGGDIFGAKVPGKIWQTFMNNYHKTFKLPKENFGLYEAIGKEGSQFSTSASSPPSGPGQPTTTTTTRDRGRPTDPPTPTTTTTTQRFPRPTVPTVTGGFGPGGTGG